MILRHRTGAILSAIFACVLISCMPFGSNSALAQSEKGDAPAAQRVVKVGSMDQEGTLSKNEDGTYSGYSYDCLMRIAQFTGWTYEFVEAQGETDNDRAMNLMEMLGEGDVDIEGNMTYAPAFGEMYEYPENNYGAAHTSLFVPNTGAVSQTNLFTQGELRMSTLESAKQQRRAELDCFCEQGGINLLTDGCKTMDELYEKTVSGEADAFLKVNAAIERINESNPTLQVALYDKDFIKSETNSTLTDGEKKYSRQHETLRVGIVSEKAPLQTFNDRTGEFKGVTKGVLDYLTRNAGLSFEIVEIPRSDDLAAAIREADVDIIGGINDTGAESKKLGVSLTAPYMSTSTLLVYNKFVDPDELENKKIALPWDIADVIPEGNGEVVVYATLEECFEAVNTGKADYTYGTSYSTPYYLSIDNLTNVLYVPASAKSIDICFGVVQPVEPELLVIINKSLRDLSTAELDFILYDNSLIDQGKQLSLFISDHLLEFALGFITLLVIIIVLLILYLRSRVHAARAVREENLRFQELYRLANEQFFEYSIKADTLRISKSKSAFGSFAGVASEVDEKSPYISLDNARDLIRANGSPELLDAFTSPAHAVTEALCSTGGDGWQWLRITSHFVEDGSGKPISVIGKIANIDDEMREKINLSERAHHDGLTSLLNWKTFQEKAAALLDTGNAGALLVVDTDDFKSVNDSYGHLAGDWALQKTAEALTQAFRPHDLVGRLGGDEFAICVVGPVDLDRLQQACTGIVERGVVFPDQNDIEHTITLSIGGITLTGKADSYQSAYRQADKALYRAKADGKDRFVIETYHPD